MTAPETECKWAYDKWSSDNELSINGIGSHERWFAWLGYHNTIGKELAEALAAALTRLSPTIDAEVITQSRTALSKYQAELKRTEAANERATMRQAT